VPDIESGKKLYNLEGLNAEDAAELMFSHGSEFSPVINLLA
jgi:hypothetical protein